MKTIHTLRFGDIEADEDMFLRFRDGIPAFEEETEFLLVPYDDTPYVFLQSAKTPELAFLAVSPFTFFADYEISIDDETLEELDIQSEEEVAIYSLITMPEGKVETMTANLLAPVIVNNRSLRAKQLVLVDSKYTTKHRLFPEA
ncbi:flagellar assembly protein FliW [Selenomonas sp. TAMA-11512]|uniref:flagellar assembly protein FliW n=1 Tax=Selenomonas sp. TAMA-11512 TaxID=3095337 RepID=UPI00308E3355|nr:flagellar assembly protein FliW [Selenomonas sp. TAMA-11512]